MAPNVVAHRITGRGVFKLQENHRDLHLPAVSNLACTFNIRNLIPTPTTTIPTIVLCFLLLSIFIAQYIRRRCHILSDHRSIESGRLAGDLKTVRFLPSNNNIHNGDEESEKSAILSIMAKRNDMRRQKKEEAAPAAPAAVLRKQARTPTPHSGPSRTISLVQGRYTGVVLPAHVHSTASASSSSGGTVPRDVEAWRGVPYAQTTAGVNRFRPPVPLPPYDVGLAGHGQGRGNFKADTFGPVCPSTASADLHAWEGEDCLNLNVYRPAFYDYNDNNNNNNNNSALLPVIIYVHGGAFNAGAGTERNMASFVSWAATPLLAVSFNYRVGALGFPSSVAAEREGCLNLGLRDQRLLFEWVRDNISAFGGDGKRVTIMGMSAGAHSIGYHLQAYTDPATAPFQGAIMESGGPTARATLAPQHPRTENQWREFLDATGIQNNNNNASSSSEQTFALLRSLPLETILRASNAVFSSYQDPIRWPFQPVIENDASNGQLITDLPISSFRRGKYLPIPILTGFNSNEGSVFCSPRVDTNEQFLDKFTTMIPGLSDKDLEALCKVYPDPVTQPDDWPYYGDVPPGFGRQWARYEAAYAHYAYICPVLQTGHFYSNDEKKSAAQPPPPIWIYNFAALSRPDFGGKANHVDEAVVVAHDMGAIGQFPGLVATSNAMHGAWVRFIATGNPNPNPPPSSSTNNQEEWWPRFKSPLMGDNDNQGYPLREKRSSDGDGHVMVFGVDNDERMGGSNCGIPALVRQLSEGEVDECRFWWERVELSEGMGRRLAVGGRARL